MAAQISSTGVTVRIDAPGIELGVKSGTITLDESWSPYVQARLVCPLSDMTLPLVDPREYVAVTITITQSVGRTDRLRTLSRRWFGKTLRDISDRYAGKTLASITNDSFHDYNTPGAPYSAPFVRVLHLELRERAIDWSASTVTLLCTSDDALLADDAHMGFQALPVAGALLVDRVRYCLSRIGFLIDDIDAAAAAAPADDESKMWEPGVSIFDYIMPQVRKAGLQLWADENRVWHLRTTRPHSAAPLELVDTENITTASDTISRDAGWYTGVVLTYKWTDAAGAPQTAYDVAYVAALPKLSRVFTQTVERPFPGRGRARQVLTSLLARGRVVQLSAISDYTATPAQPVSITLPSTPEQNGFISAVAWSFPEDEMQITTRELVDADILIPPTGDPS